MIPKSKIPEPKIYDVRVVDFLTGGKCYYMVQTYSGHIWNTNHKPTWFWSKYKFTVKDEAIEFAEEMVARWRLKTRNKNPTVIWYRSLDDTD